MNTLLIIAMIGCFAIGTANTRTFQVKFPGQLGRLRMYQAATSFIGAISFTLTYLTGNPEPLPAGFILPIIGWGLSFGILFFTATVAGAAAMDTGSMSLTSIINNMNLFVPLAWSCIFLGEKITMLRVIGVALIVATMVLAVKKSAKGKGGTSLKWFGFVMLAFFGNGVNSVLQKQYKLINGDGALMLYMAIGYLTAAILLMGNGASVSRKNGETPLKQPLVFILPAVLAGLGSFGGNALLGVLCTQVDAAVLYPSMNGGLCVASCLMSFLIFKEKPTLRKSLAIVTGLAAIVLLNL